MSAQAIAAGMQAASQIVSGFGSFQASRAQAAALKAAAKQARGEASMAAQMATDEAERAGATAAVQGAASGGGFGGSFADILDDLERTGVFNARSAIYAGNVEANNRLYEAKVAKMEGNFALASALIGAGASAGGSAMRASEQRKQAAIKKKLYVGGYGG